MNYGSKVDTNQILLLIIHYGRQDAKICVFMRVGADLKAQRR